MTKVDFTREPIIETIITPKEGHKLVVRSSKNAGQEEYFVDAVEVVTFGHGLFFRSLDRPKAFLVPISDYEVLEVREARMVLKNIGQERAIKIGGGREVAQKTAREIGSVEQTATEEKGEKEEVRSTSDGVSEEQVESRLDKKRDRRRSYRKRRGRDGKEEGAELVEQPAETEETAQITQENSSVEETQVAAAPAPLSSLLQPPPMLISDTINRYRQNDLFKGAFYLTEEEQYKPHDKVRELLSDEDDVENEESPVHPQESVFTGGEPLDCVPNAAHEEEENTGFDQTQHDLEGIAEKFKASLSLYAEEEDLSMYSKVTEKPESIEGNEEQSEKRDNTPK